MNRIITFGLSAIMVMIAMTACSTPAPTATPFVAPTQVPASPTKPPATATSVPTATVVQPTTTTAPTQAPTLAPTTVPPTAVAPTATKVPPTPTTVPTNTAVPPTPVSIGLYVSTLKIQPDRPAFNQDVTFAPTFVNTASSEQNIKWAVYIFKPDLSMTNSNNETTAQQTTFPVGSKEFLSQGKFNYGGTGRTCEYFFARVGYFNPENKIVWFTTTDGKVYEKGFQVCDVSVIPTSAPISSTSPTTIPATPKPGLFVTDLRIQPAPQRGVDLTFIPTFTNNSGNMMTFTWRVFIYKADNLATSYSETTWTPTSFTTTPGEVQSLGKWTLPLGGPCENYFARVGWQDANNQTQFFFKPDGTVFTKSFTVCPP